jgi:alkylation response protein AidB-like acyl-CoA dehydrogenase
MDFSTTDEHIALRQAVAGIAARFGNDYYTRKAEAREFTSELWQALGKHGYLGINIPEDYGGRRGRAWWSLQSSAKRPPRKAARCCCCWSPAPSAAR